MAKEIKGELFLPQQSCFPFLQRPAKCRPRPIGTSSLPLRKPQGQEEPCKGDERGPGRGEAPEALSCPGSQALGTCSGSFPRALGFCPAPLRSRTRRLSLPLSPVGTQAVGWSLGGGGVPRRPRPEFVLGLGLCSQVLTCYCGVLLGPGAPPGSPGSPVPTPCG